MYKKIRNKRSIDLSDRPRKESELADHKVIIKSKFFDELSTGELYEILKARAEIFVVEQNCVYQDLDDLDYRSLHVFCQEDGIVTAYLRAFFNDACCLGQASVFGFALYNH